MSDQARITLDPEVLAGKPAYHPSLFQAAQRGGGRMRRWRQNCNRRRPRLNQEIMPRATFLRCAAASFFRRASCFPSHPTFRWKRPSRAQG